MLQYMQASRLQQDKILALGLAWSHPFTTLPNLKNYFMEQVISAVNGVDIHRLKETITAISSQPSLAKFQFRATNEWIDGGYNRTMVKSFYGAGQEDSTRRAAF